MSSRATNLAILLLLLLELATGFMSFLVGSPSGRWVVWLHDFGALALVLLVPLKWQIAQSSFARRGFGVWAIPPLVLSFLFLAAVGTGVLWSTVGLPRVSIPGVVDGWRGLSLHVALGLLLVPLFLVHVVLRWPWPRRVEVVGRRAALRWIGLAAAGFVVWRGQEALSSLASLSGADRRFTGSRAEASFAGNSHPVTNWLSDTRQQIDPGGWQLRLYGEVEREYVLSYEALLDLARDVRQEVLDCTGGWYTVQRWSGVPVAALLDGAGVREGARTVVLHSVTGYHRRFGLNDADRLLLATHVGGEKLSAGHGFPLRLVAPGRRGYDWVKWVTAVEVSSAHPLWQPPLPLQ